MKKKISSLLIALFVLVLLLLSLYSYFVAGNKLRSWRAENTGSQFVEKIYGDYAIVGKNCQGEDTNNDGYVTCNFRLKSANSEKVITIQCPTFIKSYLGTSCKEQGLIINSQ